MCLWKNFTISWRNINKNNKKIRLFIFRNISTCGWPIFTVKMSLTYPINIPQNLNNKDILPNMTVPLDPRISTQNR